MALKGVRVLEFAGLAPAPFCGMILADFGATVIRIDKVDNRNINLDCLGNGKLSLGVDVKHPEGVKVLKRLSKTADVLIEPFRAGVMEKLGLGPNDLMRDNKRLVYARLTGYGQTGPMAKMAGHDINFISLSGVLSMLGGRQPSPPINLLGDFGGGGLLCALGIMAALLDRSRSGKGQVVDASMTHGSAYLASWLFRSQILPIWGQPRGQNVLDGGGYNYQTYETKDGKWMAVGALEPQFHDQMLLGLELSMDDLGDNPIQVIADRFKQYDQQHWVNVFKKLDACVTPVLEANDAAKLLGMGKSCDGCWAPHPAPTLSRTPAVSLASANNVSPGEHTSLILKELGYSAQEIRTLQANSVVTRTNGSKL